ncbi:Transcription elongation factor, TFIIS/CRSP70, N-terminal, sub-type [Cynara cardunculus var. scolymus]|uniref:Transcription elongation factor, TFIIS/CRSP70, N-terminal, sub-type n=1 Tax=Cynara cardunculus var. scolymus TaxID=59895 RepID=A0A118K0I0_CYNCS|nr:Transcription elongation factor, TFIIS/CRSP70, N-terminal, sub-type [Cynara cardunculus var. scolymus]
MEDLKKSHQAVMDEWRNNLRSGNVDIFEIIKTAIMVPASDHPMEFRIKRDKIAHTLFSCQLLNSSDHVEEENIGCKEKMKLSSNVDDPNLKNHDRNHTTRHEEALVDEHQETKMDVEVLKIKKVLDNSYGDESELVVYELLSKLQHMGLSFKTLEATGIGRSVSAFQKHGSRDVRQNARRLIKMWRGVADEWIEATEKTSCIVQEEKEESMVKPADKEMVSMKMKKESSSRRVIKIKIIKSNSEKAKMDDYHSEEKSMSIEEKLEASKRKLHERYSEVENAKRQRNIQVVEPHQLKKQGLIVPKTKNDDRRWGTYYNH